jgi:predicted DNA-binding protein (MmcQ/YjbR family)
LNHFATIAYRNRQLKKPYLSDQTPWYIRSLNSETFRFSVKCDPEKVIELRERYDCVQPGYHLNKKHWNTILVDGTVSNSMLKEWINDSYDLIVASLPAKTRNQLKGK